MYIKDIKSKVAKSLIFFFIYVTDFLFYNIPKKYKIYNMWEGFLPFYDI